MFKFERWMVWAGLLTACGGATTEELGSVHVKSGLISAQYGGVLEVTAQDHEALAGTKLAVPPRALAVDTRLTIDVWAANLADDQSDAAGPAVELGPDGTQFLQPVQITLPYTTGQDPTLFRVFVVESNGQRTVLMPEALTVDTSKKLVTFSINHFTRFQCGQAHSGCSHQMCPHGCAQGQCLPPDCNAPAACGPPPPIANFMCPDGTVAGPTPCHLLADGSCGYEVIECPSECQNSNDCGPNQFCNMGTCLPIEQAPCNENGACAPGFVCQEGECVQPCMTDNECANGTVCLNGICGVVSPGCMSDADCNPAQQCVDGVCTTPTQPVCMSDQDCPPGSACVNGYCGVVTPPACMSDQDCSPQEVCLNGACVPGAPECTSDQDCPPGLSCNNGYCGPVTQPVCMSDADCQPSEQCVGFMCVPVANPVGYAEQEPNDAVGNANGIGLPTVLMGSIVPATDVDYFSFVVPPGTVGRLDARLYVIANNVVSCPPGTDSVLTLYTINGVQVAANDDAHGTMCSHLDPAAGSPLLMPGAYVLVVSSYAQGREIHNYYVEVSLVP